MALPSGTHAPRDPAASVLYQVVRDHYRTFRAEAFRLRDGEGLPRFVDEGAIINGNHERSPMNTGVSATAATL